MENEQVEQVSLKDKEFDIQGFKFKFKTRVFISREFHLLFSNKLRKFIRKHTLESQKEVDEFKGDKDSYEYKELVDNYETDRNVGTVSFFDNTNNIKELFENILDGELDKINYDLEVEQKDQLIIATIDVLKDFFLIYKKAIVNVQ